MKEVENYSSLRFFFFGLHDDIRAYEIISDVFSCSGELPQHTFNSLASSLKTTIV